jgi:hypothetical protein
LGGAKKEVKKDPYEFDFDDLEDEKSERNNNNFDKYSKA